jgi:1-acyl-sn-glycerol-3-phosphate acyltransferase
MSDAFYKFIRATWGPPFALSSRPTLLGLENVPRSGPCILASTHQSYFDVPILIHRTPRLIDFVSVVEEFRKPIVGRFYGAMNAFPLDRSRADPKTVRIILDRLARGRAVLIFPEGAIKIGEDSILNRGRLRPGIGRIAKLANAPIIPVVITNGAAFLKVKAWLPLRRTRYGLIYGPPLQPTEDPREVEATLVESLKALNLQLHAAMSPSSAPSSPKG